jgi:hypothetical protein
MARNKKPSLLPALAKPIAPWQIPLAPVGRMFVGLEQLRDCAADDETFRSMAPGSSES